MLFVSTRRELDNEDRLGPTTYWELDIQDQVENEQQRVQLDVGEMLDRIRGKSILILVHGYNNEFEDIIRAYDTILSRVTTHLGDWYDEVVGFTWPGGESPLDWYEPKRRAGVVAPRLARLISIMKSDAECIDLMSHSLGSRVALGALNTLAKDTVRASFLTGSAVDNEVIEPGQQYFSAVKNGATESVVFHSRRDVVLKSAYRIAEWDNPLGLFGPENPGDVIEHLPNVTIANCKKVISGHGQYKSSDEVFEFINDWLQGNVTDQFVTLETSS